MKSTIFEEFSIPGRYLCYQFFVIKIRQHSVTISILWGLFYESARIVRSQVFNDGFKHFLSQSSIFCCHVLCFDDIIPENVTLIQGNVHFSSLGQRYHMLWRNKVLIAFGITQNMVENFSWLDHPTIVADSLRHFIFI